MIANRKKPLRVAPPICQKCGCQMIAKCVDTVWEANGNVARCVRYFYCKTPNCRSSKKEVSSF